MNYDYLNHSVSSRSLKLEPYTGLQLHQYPPAIKVQDRRDQKGSPCLSRDTLFHIRFFMEHLMFGHLENY